MIMTFQRWQEFHKASLNWTLNSRVFQTGIHKHSKFSAQNIIYRINCLNVYLKSRYGTYIDNHSLTLTWSEVWLNILSNIMRGFPDRSVGKDSWVRKLLEKGQASHSSILGFPCGSSGKESTCNARDLGSIPGLGRSPGEGKGYSGMLAWKILWAV